MSSHEQARVNQGKFQEAGVEACPLDLRGLSKNWQQYGFEGQGPGQTEISPGKPGYKDSLPS